MPTTLSAFATGEATMRYKEPYVTEGLNKKLAVTVPAGIYRGFRLTTNGAAMTIDVAADTTETDHVASYRTQGGFALTIRKTGGTFPIDLTVFANKTIVICIYCTYGVGFTTTAELRTYEVFPVDEFTGAPENSELVVLGTVVVPAAGVIPAANITNDRRRMAWEATAPEAVPWSAIVKNPSFEHGVTGDITRFSISDWDKGTLAVNGTFRLGTTTVRSGAKSLEHNKTNVAASLAAVFQFQEIPVVPGQRLRVVGWIRQLIAPTGGTTDVLLSWGDLDSIAVAPTTLTISVNAATDASFRKFDHLVEVPAGSYILKAVSIVAQISTGSTGVAFVVDDFQVYVETGTPQALQSAFNARLKPELLASLLLADPDTYNPGEIAALLRYQKSATPLGEGVMYGERKDQATDDAQTALSWYGRIVNLGARMMYAGEASSAPRIEAPWSANDSFTLMFESGAESGVLKKIRMYAGDLDVAAPNPPAQPGILFTVNARWDGNTSLWTKDINATPSTAFYLNALPAGSDGFIRVLSQATPDTWTSPNWEETFVLGEIGGAPYARLVKDVAGTYTGTYQGVKMELNLDLIGSVLAPLIQTGPGYQRRGAIWTWDGDIGMIDTVDAHGLRTQSDHWVIEEDFNFSGSLGAGYFIREDIVNVGTSSSTGNGLATLTTNAANGSISVVRHNATSQGWSSDSGLYQLGFRAKVSITDVTNNEQYLGFWGPGNGQPDSNASLSMAFKIVNGQVFVVADGGLQNVNTGLTIGTGSRWFSLNFDPVNGLVEWHVSSAGGTIAGGYIGGTYGTFGSTAENGDPSYPIVGLKTTTAATTSIQIDYIAAWNGKRFPS